MTPADLDLFEELSIEFEALGLFPWAEDDAACFCTPTNARCFARTGVDGIHYCLLPEEEAVYVVRSFGREGHVLPVAGVFREIF